MNPTKLRKTYIVSSSKRHTLYKLRKTYIVFSTNQKQICVRLKVKQRTRKDEPKQKPKGERNCTRNSKSAKYVSENRPAHEVLRKSEEINRCSG